MKFKINKLIQDWKIEAAQIVFQQNRIIDRTRWNELETQKNQLYKCIDELYELIKNKLKK